MKKQLSFEPKGGAQLLRIFQWAVLFVLVIGLFVAVKGIEAKARAVDWSEMQPSVADAEYVGVVEKCSECHEDYIKAFKKTVHGKVFLKNPQNNLQEQYCEACHGPLGKHVERPRKEEFRISLKKNGPLSQQQKNSVCLQCHEKGMQMHWRGSPHEMSDVACSDCHYLSERKSKKALLIHEDPKMACTQCHKQERAKLMRSNHMPLREGKIDCTTCHNAHGGPGPALLQTASINETCYTCHAEKRGPMLWEHPPARENCANCHDPHGTNFPKLLKAKPPHLCQSCHSAIFHVGGQYSGNDLPGGNASKRLLGKGCINCHSQVHGSNHPSGARFQR